MKKNLCKNSGLELSALGTGCWAFGGGHYWGEQNQKDVNNVVHASVDMGINFFDTAEAYNEGRSESALGEAIQGVSRDKIIIGTKVSPSNCYKDSLIKHSQRLFNLRRICNNGFIVRKMSDRMCVYRPMNHVQIDIIRSKSFQ